MTRRDRVAIAAALSVLVIYWAARYLPLTTVGQEITGLVGMGSVGAFSGLVVIEAARRALGRARVAWTLIGGACCLWSAAQFVSLGLLLQQPDLPPRHRVADNVLAGAAFLAITGFVALPKRRTTTLVGHLLKALDSVTIITTATIVLWLVLVQSILDRAIIGPTARVHLLVFVLFDIATATSTLLLASRPPAGQRVSSSFIAAAALMFVCGDVHLMHGLIDNTYHVGTIGDGARMAGLMLLAWGARAWSEPSRDGEHTPSRWRPLLLPYALLPLAFVAGAISTFKGQPISLTVVSIGGATVAAVLARQLITLGENMKLVAQMSGQEAELRHQAMHDALTGLANRRLFRERLEEAVRVTDQQDEVAVVFVDLDDFKVVNDTLGHAVGDELLRKMANRLQTCIRTTDVASRLGGDEFAVLLTRGGAVAAHSVATRLTRAMRQPIVVGGEPVFIQASVGIAVGTDELRRAPGELLEQADMAMYAAKDAGKARLAVFEPGMRERLVGRAAVKDDLNRALGRAQLLLHYQPIVDLQTGVVTGAEALLRWQHPQHGFIPPLTFIPMAEETGLINRIGRWALQTACREAAQWRVLHGRPLSVHVNFSGAQLLNPDVVDEVESILLETGLPPHLLTIEMTESVLMNDNAAVAAQMSALKSLGLRIAIDDFGTGFSGLSYLDRLPVDVLKVDKAFVDKLDVAATRPPLARAVVGLADMFGLDVVAEGIETPEQREQLVRMGCRAGQGFYFSRPVPAPELHALLMIGTLGGPLLPSIAAARSPVDAGANALAGEPIL
ncbi:MAG: diguanylate cyclase [Frankiaceae bacterium]|jgi:diguanylate cyclase (GGDEF)-like protein|nr:diguanylate cyclase [Frankiaceae bacterium]